MSPVGSSFCVYHTAVILQGCSPSQLWGEEPEEEVTSVEKLVSRQSRSSPGSSLLQDTHQNTLMCLFISIHILVSPGMAQEGQASQYLIPPVPTAQGRHTQAAHGMRILS